MGESRASTNKSISRSGPELVIGLVGAVGTELELVTRLLTKSLGAVDYSTARFQQPEKKSTEPLPTSIRLASLLHKIKRYENLPTSPIDVYHACPN